MNARLSLRIVLLLFSSLLFTEWLTGQAVSFSNVSDVCGINYAFKSQGASWGDANGDGFPDLFVSNHYRIADANPPILYINNGDGTFYENTPVIEPNVRDLHGAAFADYDNDGDQDLYVVSGNNRNILWRNEGDTAFIDYTMSSGLADTDGVGLTPIWLDGNNDGLLDMMIGNGTKGGSFSTYYEQAPDGTFSLKNTEAGFDVSPFYFNTLSDLNGDRELDGLYLIGSNKITVGNVKNYPFSVLTEFSYDYSNDIVTGDFDNNGLSDFYVVKANRVSEASQPTDSTLWFYLQPEGDEHGVQFSTGGDLDIEIEFYKNWVFFPVYIGDNGDTSSTPTSFSLSPSDTSNWGIFDHTPGVDEGVYVGYDTATGRWNISISYPELWRGIMVDVLSSEPLTLDSIFGFEENPPPIIDEVYYQYETGLAEVSATVGILSDFGSYMGVAGDFDNDMDLDLYFSCTSGLPNLPNVLLKNKGDGTFVKIANAGGAEGTTEGHSGSVTTCDYNNDGFLDLFNTNGLSHFLQGPYELFRNEGNSNNWLKIELEGTVSNVDGIGSTVYAYAGGVMQMREHHGGMHRYSQNQAMVHFGLASNSTVDSILVYWPSGLIDKVYDVPANQELTIVETGNCYPNAPVNLTVTELTPNSATLRWNEVTNGEKYRVYIKEVGDPLIRNKSSIDTILYIPSGLTPNTSYLWRVGARCNGGFSLYSEVDTFTTPALRTSQGWDAQPMIDVFPNPSTGIFNIRFVDDNLNDRVSLSVYDLHGKLIHTVYEEMNSTGSVVVDLSAQAPGMYYLRLEGPESNFSENHVLIKMER